MSGMSEPPASGHLSRPDVNNVHMAEGTSSLDPVLTLNLSPGHAKTLMAQLKGQRERGEYCDVILHVNDYQLFAHRCVLATYGSFFQNIFSQNQTNEPQHLSFPSTNPHVLRSVLEFIYNGNASVSIADIDEVLALGSTLEIKELENSCFEAMRTNLDISNWFEIKQLASKHSTSELTAAINAYISENFAFMKDDKRLLDLDATDMLAICKNCNLHGDRDIESYRFQLIMGWINYEYESRERYYAEIMQTVNPDNLDATAVHSFLSLLASKGSRICGHFVTHALIKFVDYREHFEEEGDTPDAVLPSGQEEINAKEDNEKNETKEASPVVNEENLVSTSEQTELDEVVKAPNDNVTAEIMQRQFAEENPNIPNSKRRTSRRTIVRPSKIDSEVKETANLEKNTRTTKTKRGRPRKSLPRTTSSEITTIDECSKIKKPDGSKIVLTKKERKTQHKTSSTQTSTESDSKNKTEPEVFPPVTKRPRSKKITPDTPRLKCPKCPRSFPTDCQLRHHMKGHGSDTPFLCDTCGFTTIHFGSMNVHRKLHDESQMLSCTWPGCSYKAIRKSRLEDHMNMHTGSKVYMCAVCGKGFSGRKHLHRHEKLHVDTKPFVCGDCQYSSARKDKLKDHIKKHHPQRAVEKGWLTETEAAKAKPIGRHRKVNQDEDEKGAGLKDKTEQPLSRKAPAQFENLVEEFLKAQDPLRRSKSQQQQQKHINDSLNVARGAPDTELPAQNMQIPMMVYEVAPQLHQPDVSENPHILPQTAHSDARLTNFRNSMQVPSVPEQSMTGVIPIPNSQMQGVGQYDQSVSQQPNDTGSSVTNIPRQYGSIPTSSTLSEEVLQFITYSGRMPGNNGQFQGVASTSSGQPRMEAMERSALASNTQQVSRGAQAQYQARHPDSLPHGAGGHPGSQWS